jgi:hypothetical protein
MTRFFEINQAYKEEARAVITSFVLDDADLYLWTNGSIY